MKKVILAALFLAMVAPAGRSAERLVVGVTPFPHHDIMKVAQPLMAEAGYELVIRDFTDYVQPNMALAEGQLFANFFQHIPYFDNMNEERRLGLAWIAKVHIATLGRDSPKLTSLD
ncbi:MAG: MetQ/NlpA family ABC transporter substrate-binding protein, partial [Planctomycetes bacterium]|nr:MetQ/NlpA family ABC transporter substrate-binding protein [Planctomycetota bacterium]